MDAFDRWWEWAEKPNDSSLTIPAEIHDAVMMLTPEERRDRELVNRVVREGRSPLPPGRQYGVPIGEE
jgi:hypothetical protein